MSVASDKYGGAYVSLQILCKCGSAHTEQIQTHRQMVMLCRANVILVQRSLNDHLHA